MDFKKFRKDKGLTQAQAGSLIGMSHSFWGELETGKLSDKQTTAYARVLKYIDHPEIDDEVHMDLVSMDLISNYGIKAAKAGEMIGSCYSTWKNLETGHNKMSVRYTRLINALLIELAQQSQAVQTEEVAPPAQVALVPSFDRSAVRTDIDENNMIWFCFADVCKQVDHTNPSKAIETIGGKGITKRYAPTYGGTQEMLFINEGALYKFLVRCQLPKAEAFTDWVTNEVLPSIRQSGSYSVNQAQSNHGIPSWAETLLQHMGGTLIKVQQDLVQLEARIESRLENLPTQTLSADEAAQATLEALAALNAKKAELHNLVISIVNAAKALPADDPEGQYYSKYSNAWRTVHRHARPQVSAKSDYTTIDQIQHAIDGGLLILARLGGSTQLVFDLGAA